MKLLFDFLPVLIFFAVYKYSGDIILATMVLIPVTIAQVGWTWFRSRKLETMHLVTLGLVILLGGATIAFRDPAFIQWKPTLVNWLFGIVFLGSEFIGDRNVLRRMLESSIRLPGPVWTRLNLAWVGFFFAMGAVNLYVARNFSEDIWVNFKLFGLLGMTLVFVVAQSLYLAKYMEEEPPLAAAQKDPSTDPDA